MYNWTAQQILKNPFIVYEVKVKPKIIKIITTVLENIIDPTVKHNTLYPCILPLQPQLN
jgi:hypothetical protein